MLMQEKSRGELEGVTFSGHTSLAAVASAPAMLLIWGLKSIWVQNSHLRAKGVRTGDVDVLPLLSAQVHCSMAMPCTMQAVRRATSVNLTFA
jgi:hypothetical protein